jgi:hypothetical protein
MMDMVEWVAKAIAASDEANPPIACACSGKESPEDFACGCKMYAARRRATVALEAIDHATLEAALRTIQSAIPGYLKGEMSEHDFALLVLEQADSAKVNKALEKGR